jgi:hypothetical protein
METALTVSMRKDCGRCGATVVHEARVPEDHVDKWTLQERVNIATNRCSARFTREGWSPWSSIHEMCPGCHTFVRSRDRVGTEGDQSNK